MFSLSLFFLMCKNKQAFGGALFIFSLTLKQTAASKLFFLLYIPHTSLFVALYSGLLRLTNIKEIYVLNYAISLVKPSSGKAFSEGERGFGMPILLKRMHKNSKLYTNTVAGLYLFRFNYSHHTNITLEDTENECKTNKHHRASISHYVTTNNL